MSTFSLNVCFISLNTYAIGNEEIIEQKTDNNASGIWEQAEKDGCKDGFFHYAVEEYLIDPQNNYGYKRELPIQYNKLVENPVTKKKSYYGKADIYKEIDDDKIDGDYYLWEIKPISYNKQEKKELAIF